MRNKITVLIILMSILQLSAKAGTNNTKTKNFEFGFQINPGIAWLNIVHNDATTDGAQLKYGGGVNFGYALNKHISAFSGVDFNTFGGYLYDNASVTNQNSKENYKNDYSSIDIPLGLQIKTSEYDDNAYYLKGGCYVGFIISGSENHYASTGNNLLYSQDILNLTSTTQVGYLFGFGMEHRLTGKLKLFAEFDLKNAFTNIAIGSMYALDSNHLYTQPIEIYPGTMDLKIGIKF